MEAIRDGVNSLAWQSDTFAYAAAFDGKAERYQGLCAGHADASIVLDSSSVVVSSEAARKQIAADRAAEEESAPDGQIFTPPGEQPPLGGDGAAGKEGDAPPRGAAPAGKVTRCFYGSVELDSARLNKQIPDIADLVVQHLTKLPGAEVKVTLEIQADVPDGVPHKVVIDVTQNAKDLRFRDFGFEED